MPHIAPNPPATLASLAVTRRSFRTIYPTPCRSGRPDQCLHSPALLEPAAAAAQHRGGPAQSSAWADG